MLPPRAGRALRVVSCSVGLFLTEGLGQAFCCATDASPGGGTESVEDGLG